MAATLRKLGFDVIEKTDANQKDMNRAIAQFGDKLRSDTVALFFYAGHGMQVRGKNYIIPVDAQVTSKAKGDRRSLDPAAESGNLWRGQSIARPQNGYAGGRYAGSHIPWLLAFK